MSGQFIFGFFSEIFKGCDISKRVKKIIEVVF